MQFEYSDVTFRDGFYIKYAKHIFIYNKGMYIVNSLKTFSNIRSSFDMQNKSLNFDLISIMHLTLQKF